MIRVGRRVYNKDGSYTEPSFVGFSKVLCLTKSTEFGDLSPYELRDERGRIMENVYQFSKVYACVPYTKQHYSRYDKTVTWEHPAEVHVDEAGNLTEQYWRWRRKGMENRYHVRYPVGFSPGERAKCLYALREMPDGTYSAPLDYVETRKQIYVPVYCRLVKMRPKFLALRDRLAKGENLLIIEVDGPHQEALGYYKQTYGVGDDFIENFTVVATEANIRIMLNDTKFPFGHGYCLAMALLGTDETWVAPAQMPAQAPAQMPAQMPAHLPVQVPAQLPVQVPAQPPGQVPAQPPGQVPAQPAGQVPGQIPAQPPGQVPAQPPAKRIKRKIVVKKRVKRRVTDTDADAL